MLVEENESRSDGKWLAAVDQDGKFQIYNAEELTNVGSAMDMSTPDNRTQLDLYIP